MCYCHFQTSEFATFLKDLLLIFILRFFLVFGDVNRRKQNVVFILQSPTLTVLFNTKLGKGVEELCDYTAICGE